MHPLIRPLLLSTTLFTLTAGTGQALDITQACEEALALSALPDHLRGQASVYVLQDDTFVKTVDSDGAFSCIVERNHADAIIPQCMDANGAEELLPGIMFKSLERLNGKTLETVTQEFQQRVDQGEFLPPQGPGISYMLSPHTVVHLAEPEGLRRVGPHIMFYAPGLSNEDIGASPAAARANRGLPMIINPGPHGYMVSFVEKAASGSAVDTACAGQLWQQPIPSL